MCILPSLQNPVLPNKSHRSYTEQSPTLCHCPQTEENKLEVNSRERVHNYYTLNCGLDSPTVYSPFL